MSNKQAAVEVKRQELIQYVRGLETTGTSQAAIARDLNVKNLMSANAIETVRQMLGKTGTAGVKAPGKTAAKKMLDTGISLPTQMVSIGRDAMAQAGEKVVLDDANEIAGEDEGVVREELSKEQQKLLDMWGHLSMAELREMEKSTKIGRTNLTWETPWSQECYTFCVISDSHIGEKHFQPDILAAAYDRCERDNAEAIYHAGDVVEGMSGRDGHIYELNAVGFDAQVELACDLFSKTPVPIKAISGNHDLWYMNKANIGADPVRAIERELGRDKFHHMGANLANHQVGNLKIQLRHPGDGSAYAVSYKPQKIAEGIRGGHKPHICLVGHYHKCGFFEMRNIQMFLPGALSTQTDWMRGRNIACTPGFWMVKAWQNENGLEKIEPTWYPFFEA